MQALAQKDVPFNFVTSLPIQEYVDHVSEGKHHAPTRWDLVKTLEEICDILTAKTQKQMSESHFLAVCADSCSSAGRHLTAVTGGNPGLNICLNILPRPCRPPPARARGDVVFIFPGRLVVGDVSVIYPASGSCARTAARLSGWAAARRDATKERAYWRVSSGLPFVPLRCRCFVPLLTTRRRPGALAPLETPSSRGRSGSSASPCAAATCLWSGLACTTSLGCLAGRVARPLLSLGQGGLRLSAVACLPVALADMCGCAWSLSRVGLSCVACICLCLTSALCLAAPMLLGVCLSREGRGTRCIQDFQREKEEKARQPKTKLSAIAQTRHKARLRNAKRSQNKHPKPTHGARDRPKQPQPDETAVRLAAHVATYASDRHSDA
jgi:hypothetical protein